MPPLILLEKLKKESALVGYRGREVFRSNHAGRVIPLCILFGPSYLVKILLN
jgi:hypothetical protein